MALTDEPLQALAALQGTIGSLRCNKQSRVYFDELNEQLSELQPQLSGSIASMKEAAAFGQTLKQGQLKALQEFSAAIVAINVALLGPAAAAAAAAAAALSSSGGGGSLSLSGSGSVRPSASGRKPVLPDGVSTLNPDAFYHAKQSLVLALTQLHAAFKGSSPELVRALQDAKGGIEDVGLFD